MDQTTSKLLVEYVYAQCQVEELRIQMFNRTRKVVELMRGLDILWAASGPHETAENQWFKEQVNSIRAQVQALYPLQQSLSEDQLRHNEMTSEMATEFSQNPETSADQLLRTMRDFAQGKLQNQVKLILEGMENIEKDSASVEATMKEKASQKGSPSVKKSRWR
jgi:hypothetical protein